MRRRSVLITESKRLLHKRKKKKKASWGKEFPPALLEGDKALLTGTTASFPGPMSLGSQFTGPLSCFPRMRLEHLTG